MIEHLAEEGFAHVNPPIPVWVPSEGDHVRGYILGRQCDRNGDAFYVLQLTKDWHEAGGEAGLPAGTRIAIFETHEMAACEKLVTRYQTVQHQGTLQTVAVYAYEVVLIAARNPLVADSDVTIQIHGRRVPGQGATPPIGEQPAPFTAPSIPMRAMVAALEEMQKQAAQEASAGPVVELVPSEEAPSEDAPEGAPPNGA